MTASRKPFPLGTSGGSGIVPVLAVAASLFMLAASFAAVPLYRLFCAATGFAGTAVVAERAPTVQGTRDIVVRLDANVAPGLPWTFVPETPQVKLRTGEPITVFYRATNNSDHPTAAVAMYNVSPDTAGAYFSKIACFCFEEQKLAPRESLELPVAFFLDPALEKDRSMAEVQSVTLSYTLFAAKGDKASKNPPREEP
jgi:cytochrome c oxidase assembly protein subunit 11